MRSRLDALPVEIALAGDHAEAVRRWIESVAGWQALAVGDDPAVPPVLRIADVPGSDRPGPTPLPSVLLISVDDDAAAAAAAGRAADEVLRWPVDRDRLEDVAAGLIARSRDELERPELRVGGAAGGVGTTTVALALGAIASWELGAALVITHGAVPAPLERRLPVGALAATGAWDAAERLPGVRGLRALRCDGPAVGAAVSPGAARLVIRDLGVRVEVDTLVVRRDRAGLEAVGSATSALTVCIDDGPVGPRTFRRAAAGRRIVVVPTSARVARAGARLRVPAGLPGSWLRALRPVLGGGR